MLEQNTVLEIIVFLAVSLPVLLQRVPGWDELPAVVKKAIVLFLSVAPMFAVNLAKNLIPAAVLDTNAANLIVGLFTAAGVFVVHEIDTWLTSFAAIKKEQMMRFQSGE
jgi:hypothetical protein